MRHLTTTLISLAILAATGARGMHDDVPVEDVVIKKADVA